jgi:hypothetical protein
MLNYIIKERLQSSATFNITLYRRENGSSVGTINGLTGNGKGVL